MIDYYELLKWLHICSAAIAFGSNATHLFWLIGANSSDNPGERSNILRLVKKIDDRMAIPAYITLVVCGAAMWLWKWPLWDSWIIVSLVLTLVLSAMGISFGPFMIRWIKLARDNSAGDEALEGFSRKLTLWWGTFVVTVPIILYFMVSKPHFW